VLAAVDKGVSMSLIGSRQHPFAILFQAVGKPETAEAPPTPETATRGTGCPIWWSLAANPEWAAAVDEGLSMSPSRARQPSIAILFQRVGESLENLAFMGAAALVGAAQRSANAARERGESSVSEGALDAVPGWATAEFPARSSSGARRPA
jgi:hypothetical protein